MFTGIVQEIGIVKKIIKGTDMFYINISCSSILDDIRIGDSIAVNGVCLTVVEIGNKEFTADIMPETIHRTSLKDVSAGSKVNLEPALTLSTRLGGHIVTGHVDGMGKIISRRKDGIAEWYEVEAENDILRYLIPKGSVTLDGTSLTVVDVNEKTFTVSLIPHTRQMSIIGFKGVGDYLNVECDIIGKYVEKFLNFNNNNSTPGKKSSVTMELLAENGFI